MPKTIRRTVTTVLTHEILRLSQQPGALTQWCARCHQRCLFVEPETAAAWLKVTRRTLYRAVEAGAVHFVETADGVLWLCAASCAALGASGGGKPAAQMPE